MVECSDFHCQEKYCTMQWEDEHETEAVGYDHIQVRGGGDMDLNLDGGSDEKGQIVEILWTIKFNNGSNIG